MKRIISILAFGLGSNMVCAETTIEDVYGLAGGVAPVVGIRSADGNWSTAPFKLQIGLEPLGKKKPTQIAEHKIVVDASNLKGKIPDSCVKKFSVPWTRVAKKFPPGQDERGRPSEKDLYRRPLEEVMWGSNEFQTEGQKYELGEQGGCGRTLWVAGPSMLGSIEMPAWEEYQRTQFPGLSLAKPMNLKKGRLEFTSDGQTIRIDFVAEHKKLPGNWSFYD